MNDSPESQTETDLLEPARQARAKGDPWTAMELCRERLSAGSRDAEAWGLLGRCLAEVGALSEAISPLRSAIELASVKTPHYVRLGEVYLHLGRLQEALPCFQRALQIDAGDAEALHGYAMALWGIGRWKEASATFEQAIEIQPDHAFARRNLRILRGRMIDRWQFPMVNDGPRNALYEEALKKAIDEQTVVLDLGVGTGLLSMMAARAGAGQVLACEANPWLAELAREIVEVNGFSDRIRILSKASQQIDPDKDFPPGVRPNLLVAEIFDTVVIGEGALNTLEHAGRHLLAQDAVTIPRRAELWGGLIQSERLWREGGTGQASGFDLSPLNRFHPDTLGLEAASFEGELLSEDFVIFSFDFSGRRAPAPLHQRLEIPVTRAGTCHGVVYWIKLYLDDDLTLDNRPDFGDGVSGSYGEHWYQMVKILVPPLDVKPGMTVRIDAHQNRQNVALVVYDPVSGKPRD